MTYTAPTAPAGYSWEATSEAVAARYGLPLDAVVRFDLNTSPGPPSIASRVLASGHFDVPVSDYPPSDYRRLTEAAAGVYGCSTDELVVGAGADEILDLVAKAFLPPGGIAVVPAPTYAMYRVLTEQRPAQARIVARHGADGGYALDVPATLEAGRDADVVWLCNPNNPTGVPEPDGTVAQLLDNLARQAQRDGRLAPIVVLDEAYAEFAGRSLAELRRAYSRLVVVRTASKAYALAGLRVGFAVGHPELVAAIAPYRPPGSVSVPSATIVTEALLDATDMRANVAALIAERERLRERLLEDGWSVGPSVTNFLLLDLGSPARAEAVAEFLLARGLVPRTFGSAHPLRRALRITVRTPADDERLVAALRDARDLAV